MPAITCDQACNYWQVHSAICPSGQRSHNESLVQVSKLQQPVPHSQQQMATHDAAPIVHAYIDIWTSALPRPCSTICHCQCMKRWHTSPIRKQLCRRPHVQLASSSFANVPTCAQKTVVTTFSDQLANVFNAISHCSRLTARHMNGWRKFGHRRGLCAEAEM